MIDPESGRRRRPGQAHPDDGRREAAMITTKHGIRVVAYVHTAEGLKDVDELSPAQRKTLADHVLCTWMNEIYRGKAIFFSAGEREESAGDAAGTPSVSFADR